jgi:hypothetical protein
MCTAARVLLDQFILKRRNANAHGQQEFIQEAGTDDLVADILATMQHFRALLGALDNRFEEVVRYGGVGCR